MINLIIGDYRGKNCRIHAETVASPQSTHGPRSRPRLAFGPGFYGRSSFGTLPAWNMNHIGWYPQQTNITMEDHSF